jgi:hypothetical protein
MKLSTTIIKFPEINLLTRDAHKLRGYFGNLFKEHSELLHNHYADGSSKYKYPLVQYKVIDKIPHLVGIEEGGKLLVDLFLKIKTIDIERTVYQVNSKNITNTITEIGDFSKLREYKFETLWMGLNQENHKIYVEMNAQTEKNEFLGKQIQNNILSFYKGVGFYTTERIMAMVDRHGCAYPQGHLDTHGRAYPQGGSYPQGLQEKTTKFKDKTMLAFSGSFVTNAVLPDYIGIGKSVSRGFGTIIKNH